MRSQFRGAHRRQPARRRAPRHRPRLRRRSACSRTPPPSIATVFATTGEPGRGSSLQPGSSASCSGADWNPRPSLTRLGGGEVDIEPWDVAGGIFAGALLPACKKEADSPRPGAELRSGIDEYLAALEAQTGVELLARRTSRVLEGLIVRAGGKASAVSIGRTYGTRLEVTKPISDLTPPPGHGSPGLPRRARRQPARHDRAPGLRHRSRGRPHRRNRRQARLASARGLLRTAARLRRARYLRRGARPRRLGVLPAGAVGPSRTGTTPGSTTRQQRRWRSL